MKGLRYRHIYYGELVMNAVTIVFAVVAPLQFVALMTGAAAAPVTGEYMRWYAVLLLVISYILFRALRGDNEAFLRVTMEALLVGDLAHLVATCTMAGASRWTATLVFSMFITTLLAVSRIAALRNFELLRR